MPKTSATPENARGSGFFFFLFYIMESEKILKERKEILR